MKLIDIELKYYHHIYIYILLIGMFFIFGWNLDYSSTCITNKRYFSKVNRAKIIKKKNKRVLFVI